MFTQACSPKPLWLCIGGVESQRHGLQSAPELLTKHTRVGRPSQRSELHIQRLALVRQVPVQHGYEPRHGWAIMTAQRVQLPKTAFKCAALCRVSLIWEVRVTAAGQALSCMLAMKQDAASRMAAQQVVCKANGEHASVGRCGQSQSRHALRKGSG